MLSPTSLQDGLRRAAAGAWPSKLTTHARQALANSRRARRNRSASRALRRATASGVNASWMSSGTMRSPAIRLTIANGIEFHQTAGRADRSAATADRRRPSACRGAPPARWRFPMPSARHRPPPARCRSRPSTIADGSSDARAGVEQSIVEIGARANTNCARWHRARESGRRPRRGPGRIRRTSFGTAAGQNRDRRRLRREAEAPRNPVARRGALREIDERMADELHRHAGLAVDRFLERERSRARGPRLSRIVFSRPGRHAQICGLM